MLRKCLLSLVLCGVLGTLSNAQTDSKVQISEPLSGVEAKKALQNFPKENKSALKVKKGAKGGNLYPWGSLAFDENTESYLTLSDSAGNPVLIVFYTRNNPGLSKGELLTIDARAVLEQCDSQYKDYVVSQWDPTTKTFKTRNVCPFEYYNGGHNFNAEYSEWGIPHINSFGLWIKLNYGYFDNDFTLFKRNESQEYGSGYITDYFHIKLLSSGKLSITTKMSSNYASQSVVTNKPIPIGKWVYIQAMQDGYNYQLGWKAQDGSDEELVKKTLSAEVIKLEDEAQRNRMFRVFAAAEINNNKEVINVKEVFYEPTIKTMFELMDNYNAKEKLIFSAGGFDYTPINILGLEAYKILVGAGSSIITINDFDIYYDDTTGNILAVDFRVKK